MSWIQSAFGTKISPIILFIIVLIAAVFFLAALLHLLVRFLLKSRSMQPSSSGNPETTSGAGAFQRQLQHLFHLHDSGLDQSYIDLLPVFLYKDVMGSKEHFDCAICLCEFSGEDKLRLLPSCSHAFHIDCIDTWLLSNSTCPLCRGIILAFENPVFDFDDPKEIESASGRFVGVNSSELKANNNEDYDSNGAAATATATAAVNEKRVFSVRLGKLKSTSNNKSEVGEASNSNLDARRCYSMGSFQYVVAADSQLQVALSSSLANGGSDVRAVKGREGLSGDASSSSFSSVGKKISSGSKGESFSVSKIWLWSKKRSIKFPTPPSTLTNDSISISVN